MKKNNIVNNQNTEIPQKLIDVLQSEDTATKIARICAENEITKEEQVKGISYQTGRVMVGNLLPKELAKTLEEKLKVSQLSAQKIYQDINESIFFPVKKELAILYGEEAVQTEELSTEYFKKPEKNPEVKSERKDDYREPID